MEAIECKRIQSTSHTNPTYSTISPALVLKRQYKAFYKRVEYKEFKKKSTLKRSDFVTEEKKRQTDHCVNSSATPAERVKIKWISVYRLQRPQMVNKWLELHLGTSTSTECPVVK